MASDAGANVAMGDAALYETSRGVKGRATDGSKCEESFNPFDAISLDVPLDRATIWY